MRYDDLVRLPITELKGIGKSRAELFFKQGVSSAEDLLWYLPRTYIDERSRTYISDILVGGDVIIRARLLYEMKNVHVRRMTITNGRIADETGELSVVWFNQPYMVKNLVPGQVYLFQGRIKENRGRIQLSSPKVQRASEEMPGIVPVYPLGGGLTQKMLSSAVSQTLELLDAEEDYLPLSYRQDKMSRRDAFYNIHRPETFEKMEEARNRLAFDELFVQQLALRRLKFGRTTNEKGAVLKGDSALEQRALESLPYKLTGAQQRTLSEINADLSSEGAMNRLVQGDVGSGKTAVALLSMYRAFLSGYQSALMVPTEVLARQHFESAVNMLEPLGVKIKLLTGNVTGRERRETLEAIANGEADVIIGTHALISEGVTYHNLGLVITDEQHRFGVRQRLMLSQKSSMPNVLVMTATPIPRTLAMILYGDMEISVMDEMPPGRTPVKTYSVNRSYEERLYKFMARQVEEGHQVYVICPAVEQTEDEAEETLGGGTLAGSQSAASGDDEKLDLRAAVEYSAFLQQQIFPQYRVGVLHGKMRPAEKEIVMDAFAKGDIQILVSTTVIEVGVNVPNATLMVIENAERFGLAQLHQLRGRVGRGKDQSYCVLVTDSKVETTRKRMKILVDSTDGFYLSEQDLLMRGSGDIFGLRQHGLPDFRAANLYQDLDILKSAQALAATVMEIDPELKLLEHQGLNEELNRFLERATSDVG